MHQSRWQEMIDETQRGLRECPGRCFVCEGTVPAPCQPCAAQAFRDAAHTERLAVVCGRAACLRALEDAHTGTWQRLFQALAHWPDPGLYPLGPYWVIRRGQRHTLRTEQRRTTYVR